MKIFAMLYQLRAIHVKTFSVNNASLSLMFTIYKTRIIFYLWYIA